MMGDSNSNSNMNMNINVYNSKDNGNSSSNQISSLVLDHLFSSSSSLCPPLTSSSAAASTTSVDSSHVGDVAHLTSRATPPAHVPVGFDPDTIVEGSSRRPTSEADVGSYDGESEEGVDVVEEPVEPSGQRSSGSKRSRAAEVHNLSEKRRRSKINEKMKALQSLIPNSNKTDKASMLDEAIEYLKQLQLQVQMLSMRNGLSLSPAFLPGVIPALQSSEMHLRFSANNEPPLNYGMNGVHLAPVSQDFLIRDQLHLPNQCTSSVRSHTPHVSDVKDSMLTFAAESSLAQPSNVQHGSLNVSVTSGDVYTKGMMSVPQLGSFHIARQEPQMRQLTATISRGRSSISEVNPDDRQILKNFTA